MIYLDNAATTSPKPKSVIQAVDNALTEYCANPGRSGHAMSAHVAEMIYNTRKKTADFFGASDPQNIVFTLNCTMALNTVIQGLFKCGDHVIISSLEHNAVFRPVWYMRKYCGVCFDIADVSFDDMQTLKNFKKLLKPNTKAIICTYASNVFGIRLPIKALGRLCKEYGLILIVDAAQAAGVVDINCKRDNIDYLCIAPHKGLYAPMGTGILITDEKPNPLVFGGTGTLSMQPQQPPEPPERFESGTVNVAGIAGIYAGIDFVEKRRFDIYFHEMFLIRKLYKTLKQNPNVILYTPEPDIRDYVPVLSFNIKDKSSEEVASVLSERGFATRAGLHCAPLAHECMGTIDMGTVRVCPSVFTTESDIDKFSDTVNEIFK